MALEHFWRSIPGHCTFPDFYAWLATTTPAGGRLVELGCFHGQSAACLGVELVNRQKSAHLFVVDASEWAIAETRRNLAPLEREMALTLIHDDSAQAAGRYEDLSFDAVFIDADHRYENVAADIDAWWPKLRRGGILAGHDFTDEYPGVAQAVVERFAHIEIDRGIRFQGPDGKGPPGAYYPVWFVRKETP